MKRTLLALTVAWILFLLTHAVADAQTPVAVNGSPLRPYQYFWTEPLQAAVADRVIRHDHTR